MNKRFRSQIVNHLLIFLAIFLGSCSDKGITILCTTDLHGYFLPHDYVENEKLNASLAHVSDFINRLERSKNRLLLLDNGDNLQGQPAVYYFNFIDTVTPHINTKVMNWLGYEAGTIGNHDIEAGHHVYDRLKREYKFPMLAANAIDVTTGKPYFEPYTIIKKKNLRIAVFGLVTPAIPNWLPPDLYSGMEFRDMAETAEYWMPEILKHDPDLVIGLFHAGWNREDLEYSGNDPYNENGTAEVAYNVPGFDIIFAGHDHRLANEKFVNRSGDTVLILNAGSRSENIALAEVAFSAGKRGGVSVRSIKGEIVDISDFEPDDEFVKEFELYDKKVLEYAGRVIGTSATTISTRDSYFGSSALVDMIHAIQLGITDADLSFAAPLSFDVKISEGPVTIGDMFKLYRYENKLYTMNLTGNEIRNYLEYSYAEWLNTMKDPDDFLLKFRLGKDGKPIITDGKAWTRNQSYNFDSAAGIDYLVDVSKPEGQRIVIKSFSDGKPFEMQRSYRVALNSYRGNGGGGHLTEGAGIDKEELIKRLILSTDHDLRFYILQFIETQQSINPLPFNNWRIVPEEWAKTASARDYRILFG
ncbi:MAG: bifunctional metallophosphatase/5'-nucleotidase, partial [Bacteroidales bacterium]|nr:bifunctional metallophosphatase/5'-nucleotidase [Bacteroidales bacterium]